MQEANQIAPEDAYVAFNNTEFVIMPETEGSQLNVKQAYRILEEAISSSLPSVDFAANPDAYNKAAVVSTDPELQDTVMAYNNFTKANITYTFGEQTVTLDEERSRTGCSLMKRADCFRIRMLFSSTLRIMWRSLLRITIPSELPGSFIQPMGVRFMCMEAPMDGKIDQAGEAAQLLQDIQNGVQTTREPVYEMRANAHGYNDIGSTYIEVDMGTQHMYYYQDGYIIFDSEIVSGLAGDPDRETPPGIFKLYSKSSPSVLRGGVGPDGGYEYETPVQYWMPFNGGIGFHDADWQPYFGGDRYLYGGSHGCINMPPSNAATLYSIIQYDVPIVCFY